MSEKAIIPIGPKGIQLSSFDELYRFSKFVIEAGLAPASIDTAEKVFLAIQYSMEMGFSPMVGLQNCMVINNRVSFFGELVVGQVEQHPEFENMTTEYTGEGQDLTCTVTIKRKGMTPSVGEFSIRQATHLINDPSKSKTWGRYPRRMLFWRAFSRAKVIFSDALKGIVMPSDIEDEDPKPANVLTITKPTFKKFEGEFQNETEPENSDTRQVVDPSGTGQPDGESAGAAVLPDDSDSAGSGKTKPESKPGPASNLPGHREPAGEGKQSKPLGKTKADRLLALINKEGFAQSDVIGFLDQFNMNLGSAKASGLVHDLPEETITPAIAQWETIKHDLAKAK